MRRSTVRHLTLLLAVAAAGLTSNPVRTPQETGADEPSPAAEQDRAGDRAAPRPEAEPVPDGVAALIDDELVITLDEYKDHLLTLYGKRPLEELVYRRLLEREADRLGVAVEAAAVEAAVEEQWHQLLELRHRGRLEDVERELGEAGYTPATYRASLRSRARIEALEAAIVEAGRVVTEEQVAERFERDFGAGGVRVEVRHIYLNRARLKADLIRAGADPTALDNAALDVELEQRAEALLGELEAGADFEALARAHSHDLSVQQNGGFIPGYNYRRYGEPLAQAVRAAAVGEPTGPVHSMSGLHLIEVTARTVTDLESVRDELAATLAAEPASWKERGELRARLFGQAVIRTF